MFNSGVRPAINVGISVSRVGGNAQIKGMKKVAGTLKLDLAQYRELEAFAKFGSDLDKATRDTLAKGERLVELLKQNQHVPIPVEKQVVAIFYGTKGFLETIPVKDVKRFQKEVIEFIEINYSDVLETIRSEKVLSDETVAKLNEIGKEFLAKFQVTE